MQDDGETIEMADVQGTEVMVEGVVDKEIVDREEAKMRMLLFRRWCIESAEIQPICPGISQLAAKPAEAAYPEGTLS